MHVPGSPNPWLIIIGMASLIEQHINHISKGSSLITLQTRHA